MSWFWLGVTLLCTAVNFYLWHQDGSAISLFSAGFTLGIAVALATVLITERRV